MKSTLNPNSPKSKSLRTTVPMAVIETLDLKNGDELDWSLKPDGSIMVAVVKKA